MISKEPTIIGYTVKDTLPTNGIITEKTGMLLGQIACITG
jgi:hypothetical protein